MCEFQIDAILYYKALTWYRTLENYDKSQLNKIFIQCLSIAFSEVGEDLLSIVDSEFVIELPDGSKLLNGLDVAALTILLLWLNGDDFVATFYPWIVMVSKFWKSLERKSN